MASLHNLQTQCLDAIRANDSTKLRELVVSNHIPMEARLSVYANNYKEILHGALLNAYPVVQALAGADCFRSLAGEYSRQHESISGDLQDFGNAFPSFLDSLYGAGEFAYFGDVARLERAIERCLLNPFQPAVDEAAFQNLAHFEADQIVLAFAPSTQLISSRYPILSIWQSHQTDSGDIASIKWESENVLIVREHLEAQMRRLDDTTHAVVMCLIRGETLGKAIEESAIDDPETLGSILRILVQSNAITGFSKTT